TQQQQHSERMNRVCSTDNRASPKWVETNAHGCAEHRFERSESVPSRAHYSVQNGGTQFLTSLLGSGRCKLSNDTTLHLQFGVWRWSPNVRQCRNAFAAMLFINNTTPD